MSKLNKCDVTFLIFDKKFVMKVEYEWLLDFILKSLHGLDVSKEWDIDIEIWEFLILGNIETNDF